MLKYQIKNMKINPELILQYLIRYQINIFFSVSVAQCKFYQPYWSLQDKNFLLHMQSIIIYDFRGKCAKMWVFQKYVLKKKDLFRKGKNHICKGISLQYDHLYLIVISQKRCKKSCKYDLNKITPFGFSSLTCVHVPNTFLKRFDYILDQTLVFIILHRQFIFEIIPYNP